MIDIKMLTYQKRGGKKRKISIPNPLELKKDALSTHYFDLEF